MQESAKAKEAAKRAREAEVFILNPQGAPTTHTVPKPFMLHESTHQVGHQQAVESTPACCTVGSFLYCVLLGHRLQTLVYRENATLFRYIAQPLGKHLRESGLMGMHIARQGRLRLV